MYYCKSCKKAFCENCVKLSKIASALSGNNEKSITIDFSNELVDRLFEHNRFLES